MARTYVYISSVDAWQLSPRLCCASWYHWHKSTLGCLRYKQTVRLLVLKHDLLDFFCLPFFLLVMLICFLKVRQSRNNFSSQRFLQKTNEQILLHYYETWGRLVFVRFFGGNWRHQKDISKLTDLYIHNRRTLAPLCTWKRRALGGACGAIAELIWPINLTQKRSEGKMSTLSQLTNYCTVKSRFETLLTKQDLLWLQYQCYIS